MSKDSFKQQHPDGEWNTSKYNYRGCVIMIKSELDKGMKAHCFADDKVIFTQRFRWIKPDKLLARMKSRIDMWKSGTWVPKKLLKDI